MKHWMKRLIVALSLLGLAIALPATSGCNKAKERPDYESQEGFVDTSDPTALKMPAMGGGTDSGAVKMKSDAAKK